MKVTTASGFKCELADDALDNYELLETLVAIEKGDGRKITEAVDLLLDADQKNALKDYLKKRDGRVSTKVMWQEVVSILQGSSGKNS